MAITERHLSTMVLVIATGGAGLRVSIELAEAGVDVPAVGKRPKDDAHTALAAGGINAALATMVPRTAGSSTPPTRSKRDTCSPTPGLAARATLESALERRERRGCHNRSDYPETDTALRVNLVWSPTAGVTRESIPPIPDEIASLMGEISTAGKLVE